MAATEMIKLGNNVLIASKVYITDHDHGDTSFWFFKNESYK